MSEDPCETPTQTEKRDRWGIIARLNPGGEPTSWMARKSQATERQKRILQFLTQQPCIRRRWFQFKLSTTLVLVGILAWAMSSGSYGEATWSALNRAAPSEMYSDWAIGADGATLELDAILGARVMQATVYVSPKIIWPLVAFAAFLSWKLGCAIAARRKPRRGVPGAT